MISNNYFTDNEDVLAQFEQLVDWEEIVKAYEGDDFADAKKYKETGDEKYAMAPGSVADAIEYYRAMFESAGEIAGTIVSQKSQEMDHEGLKFENGKVTFPEAMTESYMAIQEAGLQPYSLNRKFGGLGIPVTAQVFFMEMISRADASMAIAAGCANLGETIERYGSKEMVEEWVPKMARGEVIGAMALTEPNHGSDLPNIRTKAEQREDGTWIINGTKRFITHGCGFTNTPSVILTLARTGSPESGARGLSFFLVKGEDVQIAGIEHKMGLHCSPTCEVVYEDTPGILIGETGQGLVKYAMGMMNTARLSIAGQSLGIAVAAHKEARKYAQEREQFGKTIENIPAVKKMLDRMEREEAAMRTLILETGRTIDRYLWRAERLEHEGKNDREIRKDEEVRKWDKIASFLTPLSKYYISEMCNTLAYDAVQIHGGSGYTEEYDVARIYRDARITNIYEGTTQLQVVAAIGGVVAGMTPTGYVRAYIEDQMKQFAPSKLLNDTFAAFEDLISKFREVSDSGLKDAYAFEMVEAAGRFITGMLFEKTLSRIEESKKAKRQTLVEAYHRESISIIKGNQVRIELEQGTKQPVAG